MAEQRSEHKSASAGRAIVWLRPEQGPLLAAALDAAGLEPISAGAPDASQTGAAAAALGVPACDDLRTALNTGEADLILLAACGPFGTESADAAAVAEAHRRGVTVATMEPVPASALELRSGRWLDAHKGLIPIECLRSVPLPRRSAAFREAAEVLEAFGHVRTASAEFWCTREESSLASAVFGGLELLEKLMGEPETVDAAIVAPDHGGGVHSLPGETLRGLAGEAVMTLRYADGRAASIVAGDRAGRWNRSVTLLGPAGRLKVFDDGFEWLDPEGAKVDSSRATPGRGRPAAHATDALAHALHRLAGKSFPDEGPIDHASVLAIAQAALLSARTGHPESPGTIRRMLRVG